MSAEANSVTQHFRAGMATSSDALVISAKDGGKTGGRGVDFSLELARFEKPVHLFAQSERAAARQAAVYKFLASGDLYLTRYASTGIQLSSSDSRKQHICGMHTAEGTTLHHAQTCNVRLTTNARLIRMRDADRTSTPSWHVLGQVC